MTSGPTLDRNAYRFQTEIRVRLSETDAVGIVFFGSFATYMDVGRMDYLNHLGYTQLAPGAVVSAHLDFKSPARYNDTLIVDVRVADLGNTSYTFHFLITNKRSRAVIALGSLTLVWLDEAFQPLRIPDGFRELVRQFEDGDA